MNEKWTKGPWYALESSERCPMPAGVCVEVNSMSDGSKVGTICEIVAQGIDGKYDSYMTSANGNLISAAPELYDALKELVEWFDCESMIGCDFQGCSKCNKWENARAALRKARGE